VRGRILKKKITDNQKPTTHPLTRQIRHDGVFKNEMKNIKNNKYIRTEKKSRL
jgi:hypothetical protein